MQLQVAGDIDELLHEEKWCEADQKVVNVFDPNVREWSVTTSGGARVVAE